MNYLTIGKLAKRTGVSTVTIRYYEQCGLIPKATRTPAGYRLYPESVIEHIYFLKSTKTAGFSLAEIGELVALLNSNRPTSNASKTQLLEKANMIKEKIIALKNVQKMLETTATTGGSLRVQASAMSEQMQAGRQRRTRREEEALA